MNLAFNLNIIKKFGLNTTSNFSVVSGGDSSGSGIFVSLGSVGIGNDGGVRGSGVVLLMERVVIGIKSGLGGGLVGSRSGGSSGNGGSVLSFGWGLSVGVGGDSGLSGIFSSLGGVGIGNLSYEKISGFHISLIIFKYILYLEY